MSILDLGQGGDWTPNLLLKIGNAVLQGRMAAQQMARRQRESDMQALRSQAYWKMMAGKAQDGQNALEAPKTPPAPATGAQPASTSTNTAMQPGAPAAPVTESGPTQQTSFTEHSGLPSGPLTPIGVPLRPMIGGQWAVGPPPIGNVGVGGRRVSSGGRLADGRLYSYTIDS